MKRVTVLLLSAIGLVAAPAMSQTGRGSWELSLAGNLGSYSISTEITSGGHTTSNDGESHGYLGLDLRTGWYLADGLSIEPEIYYLAVEKEPPTFNLGANLNYTFTIPQSPVKPFIIAGYGVGNGIPLMQRLLGRTSDNLDIPVLRIGCGLKVFFSKQVAFKIEYRYERYSYENTTTFYSYSYTGKEVWDYHNVLFGFSVFLPVGD